MLPRDEFEGRFGPLPPAFPDNLSTVTIDNRDLAFHERLTATGKPLMQATRNELELDLAINRQIETQLQREHAFMEILERLMEQKFGRRVNLEGLSGDVWDEAEAAWRAAETNDPPIGRDDEIEPPHNL